MSVAELHPEELFDKLVDGALTSAERERLGAHLQACAVCRFDYGARFDFEQEARAAQQRLQPSLPLQPVRAPRPLVVRRRRSRALVWGAFAAVLISGSGALAALGERPWRALAAIFVSSAAPPSPSHAGAAVPRSKTAPAAHPHSNAATDDCQSRDCAAASSAAPASGAEPPLARVGATAASPLPLRAGAGSRNARAVASLPAPGARQLEARTLEPAPSTRPSSRNDANARSSADAATPAAALESSSAARLFAEGNQARRQGQVGRAFTAYQLLQEQYPGSSEAELSRVTVATLLLSSGDASGALRGFDRYLAGPSRALQAEALVGRARALQRLGRKQQETAAWREVRSRFPGSIYARQAAERLTALGPP